VPTWSDTRSSLFINAVSPKLTRSVSRPNSPAPVPLDQPTPPSFPTFTTSMTSSRTTTCSTCLRITANSSSLVRLSTGVVPDLVLLHLLHLTDRPPPLSLRLLPPPIRHLHQRPAVMVTTKLHPLQLPSRPSNRPRLPQRLAPRTLSPHLVGQARLRAEVSRLRSKSDSSSIAQALLPCPTHLPQLLVIVDKPTASPWLVVRPFRPLTFRMPAKTRPTSCRTPRSL
jgi:hypothetical protein